MKQFFIIFITASAVLIISFFGFYSYWNHADPENTCASCHEITSSVATWQHSAHRDIRCFDCHGTALGNGIHSLKEKANMVLTHVTDNKWNEEIRMNEKQVLEVSVRCTACHQSEYAKWRSGGHSADYSRIFLDSVHNSTERLYWDCFRCHGMYYEGMIYDLITPVSTKGPWRLLDGKKADQPTMPCLTCHQIHTENFPYKTYTALKDTSKISYRHPGYGLYIRSDKLFLRADYLSVPEMFAGDVSVKTAQDPQQSLCIQCHSPRAFHQVGTSDDRTPTGVHKGLSCLACHEPHSNDARWSCNTCHPAISNCGLDVKSMNTTFSDLKSPFNIHFVSCQDCHNASFLSKLSKRGLSK